MYPPSLFPIRLLLSVSVRLAVSACPTVYIIYFSATLEWVRVYIRPNRHIPPHRAETRVHVIVVHTYENCCVDNPPRFCFFFFFFLLASANSNAREYREWQVVCYFYRSATRSNNKPLVRSLRPSAGNDFVSYSHSLNKAFYR